MGKAHLIPENKYLWRNKEVTLVELSAGRAIVRLSDDSIRSIKNIELEDVSIEAGYEDHSHMLLPQVEWDRLVKIRNALVHILSLRRGRSKAVSTAVRDIGCSERQIFRYLKAYQQSPNIFVLMGAKAGRPCGLKMLGSAREQIIEECIDSHYLKRERPTVSQLHRAIQHRCVLSGLPSPVPATIRRRIRKLGLEILLRRREGSKEAKEILKGVPGHVEVEHVLDRIEIDHTPVDVILRADTKRREVADRPWLTLAIDCKTRMILGFYLGFERPTVVTVAKCLAMAALPKESWLRDMGINGHWPAQGIPAQIWVDNAMEFQSHALQRGCDQHEIILNFRPVGSPEFGGMIERLIGTMMGHVHLLPGTTKSSVATRGDYDSEKRSVMTLSEFIPWFAEQVVTQYHLQIHRGIQMSPLQAWEMDAKGRVLKVPRDPFEYYASFLPAATRVLTRTGVQLHKVNYWSDRFSPWIGHNLKVLAHYHPLNIEYVYVRLPDGSITAAKAQMSNCRGLSLHDLLSQQEGLRILAKDPERLRLSAEGAMRNEERVKEATLRTFMAKKVSSNDIEVPPQESSTPNILTIDESITSEEFFVQIDGQEI